MQMLADGLRPSVPSVPSGQPEPQADMHLRLKLSIRPPGSSQPGPGGALWAMSVLSAAHAGLAARQSADSIAPQLWRKVEIAGRLTGARSWLYCSAWGIHSGILQNQRLQSTLEACLCVQGGGTPSATRRRPPAMACPGHRCPTAARSSTLLVAGEARLRSSTVRQPALARARPSRCALCEHVWSCTIAQRLLAAASFQWLARPVCAVSLSHSRPRLSAVPLSAPDLVVPTSYIRRVACLTPVCAD